MRSKKEWFKWFKNLKDDDISQLFELRKKLEHTPKSYDKDIFNFIKESQKIKKEKPDFIEKFSCFFNKKPLFSYGLASAIIIFLIILLGIFPLLKKNYLNKAIVTYFDGDSYLINNKKEKTKLKLKSVIKENNLVETEKNSNLKISIDDKATISLKENSSLNFNKLYKNKDKEITELFLNIGESHFIVSKLNGKSSFKVETETIIIEVAGTEFIVSVDKDKTTKVIVKEGRLLIQPKINVRELIKSIKKADKNFSNKIELEINEKFLLKKGEILEVTYNNFFNNVEDIKSIIKSINTELNNIKRSKIEVQTYINNSNTKFENIKILKKNIFQITNEKKEDYDSLLNTREEKELKYFAEKISQIQDVAFTEKNTAINADERYLYISSNSNTMLYCYDTSGKKIKWTFTDPSLTDITCSVVQYKENIILPTFNKIYNLNKNGTIISSQNISNGTNFWASIISSNNLLYIPTSSGVLIYDGNDFKELENLGKVLGQLYITIDDSILYFLDSNEQKVKEYDLEKKEITWISEKLENRSFSSPLKSNNYLIIPDYKSNIYKFNLETKNTKPKTLNIKSGIISNLIIYNDKLFFIANNGFLYSIDIEKFNNAIKLEEVDYNPNYNNYLTKKILKINSDLYFSSNTGKIFHYDLKTNKASFIKIDENMENLPLIGTPVAINNIIYLIDIKANIYKLIKK